MPGGGQRADHAQRQLVDEGLVGFGVVALVIDECQLSDLIITEPQVREARLDQLDRLGELRAVVAIALIGLVTQREVGVQRHAQRQPDQPQIPPAALRVPALSDRVALVGGVDERLKVRGVIDQRAQLDPVALDRAPHDLGLGRGDHLV